MGGRKKTGKKEKKLRTYAIPKMFDCEKCSADQTLNIQIKKDKNKKYAKIFCVKCKLQEDKVPVAPLDSAIDVYNKWCERQSGNGHQDYEDDDYDDDLNGVIDEDADVNEDDIPDHEF